MASYTADQNNLKRMQKEEEKSKKLSEKYRSPKEESGCRSDGTANL